MRKLAKVPSQVSRMVALEIQTEIQDNFDRGLNPYGNRWRPIKESTLRRRKVERSDRTPLTDTGWGRLSITAKPGQGAGVKLAIGISYMEYHDRGRGVPKRQILPVGVLPRTWEEIWQRNLTEQAERLLR